METNPMVPLASSVQAGPGTFAMLLGSGVSMSSGVPTGWAVTRDLITRLAEIRGEDPGPCPFTWYREQTGGEPNYSELLTELAPGPMDRRNLLSKYFEPSSEDREQGLKLPTRAHRAIASLIADGYIKLIITTNFDRLLEVALSDAGVQPNVISTPGQAVEAIPLVHSRCTIIKVHGDYQSPDLKNTVEELDTYDARIDDLLDGVFEQYGIIVCGWSADWDRALRAALQRATNWHFTTYWLHRGPLGAEAKTLVAQRDAVTIEIEDADTAMDELLEKVRALSDLENQTLTTEIAVAQLKRYLPDPVHRIRLHDLVVGETNAAITEFQDLSIDSPIDQGMYLEQMDFYERAMARLLHLIITGTYFSDRPEHNALWIRCIDRLANRSMQNSGSFMLLPLQQYPTLLALHAVGLGAMAAERITPFAEVLGRVAVRTRELSEPVAVAAASARVMIDEKWLVPARTHIPPWRAPISERLAGYLRDVVDPNIPEGDHFDELFDDIEYTLGVAYAAHDESTFLGGRASRPGRSTNQHLGARVKRNRELFVHAGVFDDTAHLDRVCGGYEEQMRDPLRH